MAWALLALLSAAFESGALIAEKKGLIKEHAMEFSSSMALFAMLFTTPLWIFSSARELSLEAVGWIFLAALTSALTILFFAKALRHMAISYTTPFLAIGPLVTLFLAVIFYGERVSAQQFLGIIVIIFGAYSLYSHHQRDWLAPIKQLFKVSHMKFVLMGILAYAITGLLDKRIVGASELAVPVLDYVVLLFFFIGVIFILMMLLVHDGFKGIGNGMQNNTKWLAIVAILTIGMKVSIIWAIAIPGALLSLVIPIKKLTAIFSTIIGGEMFHEDHLARKAIASALMIIGAALILI